jgi:hypothetical protein
MLYYLLVAALVAVLVGGILHNRRMPYRGRGLRAPNRGVTGEAGKAMTDLAEQVIGVDHQRGSRRRR